MNNIYLAQLNKRGLTNTRPYAKPSSNNSKRSQLNSQQRPPAPAEQFSKTAVRVMSAQRLKNNDLQNDVQLSLVSRQGGVVFEKKYGH